MDREVTREELKNNALLERIAMLENERAELRVDLTMYAQQAQRHEDRIKELEEIVNASKAADDSNLTD